MFPSFSVQLPASICAASWFFVNLTALARRLEYTCLMSVLSPYPGGILWMVKVMFLSVLMICSSFHTSMIMLSMSSVDEDICFLLRREKDRRSSMSWPIIWVFDLIALNLRVVSSSNLFHSFFKIMRA